MTLEEGKEKGEERKKERGGEMRQERRRKGEGERGERKVVPSTQGWNKLSTASQNTTHLLSYFGNCGSCPFTPRLSFPTQLTTHALTHTHTHARAHVRTQSPWWGLSSSRQSSGPVDLLNCKRNEKQPLILTNTNLHSNIWPTKDHWTFEKNQTGGKRKTRKKK